ncbi:glycosyltransferase family 4 protein [Oscillatoria sp. FACHB-1407]|uniref:glycosyltransferase family 4 protein n=1 Tax=Oscillatoria sp. FACHB-1407 TaxID=2692847 RepID=UPI001683C36C|nr:glycosyltransferase family 4 protein [Oscillatoria sp. FACHB-1407]MBD2460895.1 glycosyltransferase family 4 protein [Oscillatoria sp. FACHB-1407]
MKRDRLPHVVIYTDAAGIGGAEISVGHLVATVSSHFQITVVGVVAEVVNAIADRRPDTVRVVLPAQGIRSWMAHLATFQKLKPDIIHCNLCTPWACAIALFTSLVLPQARVVRVDQLPLRTTDLTTWLRTRLLSLRVDAHVAVGEASACRMEDFYALGRNTVISIPNGVPDLPNGTSLSQGEQGDHKDGRMIVGSIGRLDAMKAHDVLLRAIAQVDGVRVVILGEGAERPTLERLAMELGVSDRLQLPGWVNPQTYLPRFDVVAMPSRSEGFPLAMVEAMLAAKPVIATRVGSMPEAVLDGQTGLLIEKNDVEGLAQALRRLRDNPQWRSQLGQQARELAIARFTVEAMTHQYEEVWDKVLNSPQKPRLKVPPPKD